MKQTFKTLDYPLFAVNDFISYRAKQYRAAG